MVALKFLSLKGINEIADKALTTGAAIEECVREILAKFNSDPENFHSEIPDSPCEDEINDITDTQLFDPEGNIANEINVRASCEYVK